MTRTSSARLTTIFETGSGLALMTALVAALGSVRTQREPATDQQRNHLNPAVKIAESRRRDHGARRDANERVDNVPDAINHLNLVSDKFDHEKETARRQSPTSS